MEPLIKSHLPKLPWYMKSEYDYTNDWFLLSSPFPSIAIVLVYLVFIIKLGPALMENREPFKLKTTLVIYNTFQVLFSLYIFLRCAQNLYVHGLVDKKCIMNDLSVQKVIVKTIYIYFIAKITELADTVFFVLRKKTNQITFLHLYHHSLMLISTFAFLKYSPHYSVIFTGAINSLVHVFMYSYYGLAAFPSMEKYLWWKKYLTSFQLIQFVMIFIQISVSSFASKCPPPHFILYHFLFNLVLMIYLFSNFYVKSYGKKGDTGTKFCKNDEMHKENSIKSA